MYVYDVAPDNILFFYFIRLISYLVSQSHDQVNLNT